MNFILFRLPNEKWEFVSNAAAAFEGDAPVDSIKDKHKKIEKLYSSNFCLNAA